MVDFPDFHFHSDENDVAHAYRFLGFRGRERRYFLAARFSYDGERQDKQILSDWLMGLKLFFLVPIPIKNWRNR